MAIRRLKGEKACGGDMIEPEMIKYLGEKGREWMWKICADSWREQKIPKDWENNIIIPIHKGGDQASCDNYRAICLSSVCFKVYTRIVEERLRSAIEDELDDSQAAFRTGRQTGDNIFVVRNIIERKIEEDEELFLTFIDLRAAFDTIEREQIWKSLAELGVHQELIIITRSIYGTVNGRVQLAVGRSDVFRMG